MRCFNCGAEVLNGSMYCTNCGATLNAAPNAQQPMQQGYQQPMQQGYPQQPMQQGYPQQPMQQNVSMQGAGWGLKILSLLIPLAGVILYFVKKNNEPVAAKDCIIFAAIGFGIGLLYSIV